MRYKYVDRFYLILSRLRGFDCETCPTLSELDTYEEPCHAGLALLIRLAPGSTKQARRNTILGDASATKRKIKPNKLLPVDPFHSCGLCLDARHLLLSIHGPLSFLRHVTYTYLHCN